MTGRIHIKYIALFFICFFLLICGCSSNEKKKEEFLSEGKVYFEKQEYKKAVIQLKNAIKIDPESIEAYKMLAQSYFKSGQAREAFSTYLRLEQLDPENLEIKIKLATFYLFGKKNQEAESRVNQVLLKEPENIEALYLQAAILNANKDKLDTINYPAASGRGIGS